MLHEGIKEGGEQRKKKTPLPNLTGRDFAWKN